MEQTPPAPASAEELRAQIVLRYEGLSKRLKQIARHILDEPNDFALETLSVIASRCGVQPSTIVRFAKTFGFEGASQMQRLFRDGLLSSHAALGYSERIRQLNEATHDETTKPADLLSEFVEGNILALQNLTQTVSRQEIEAAVEMISRASTVHVTGFRRAFPVASYLVYSLLQAGKRTVFIDGVAGLAMPQVKSIAPDDLLIAISYHPYAAETVAVVEAAREGGARVLAISDSAVSPISAPADLALLTRESEVRSFRSLSASMCLAQALVINFAFAATQPGETRPRKRRNAS